MASFLRVFQSLLRVVTAEIAPFAPVESVAQVLAGDVVDHLRLLDVSLAEQALDHLLVVLSGCPHGGCALHLHCSGDACFLTWWMNVSGAGIREYSLKNDSVP